MRLRAKPGEDLRVTMRAVCSRFQCTAATPWSGRREDAPNGVRHVDARVIGVSLDATGGCDTAASHSRGETHHFECPHCGTRWSRSEAG
jgi:hypothetical protein